MDDFYDTPTKVSESRELPTKYQQTPPDTNDGSFQEETVQRRAARSQEAWSFVSEDQLPGEVHDTDNMDVATLNPSERFVSSEPWPPNEQPIILSKVVAQPQQSQAIRGTKLVAQFGSSETTLVAEYDDIRLQVRPGCLRGGQVAGPITMYSCDHWFVECAGESYLMSVLVDCQPWGVEFDEPLYMEFRVGESFEEDEEDGALDDDAIEQREAYMKSLGAQYKV